ncbi:MAG: glycosyltransferase family 4 protein [Bacteroidetes bacterium]|nr:glycosyltransferase family 4 protein [Bacteroidota bacterium]
MDKHLHIVTLDVPWPADYGGVVDLFYKLKALHQLGIKIHLHCFTSGRSPQDELNKYCVEVNYYPRKKNISSVSLRIPYIVSSRKSDALIANLNKDDYPVLLEGIHCTYYLYNGALINRKVMVRLHNAEFEYYKQLAVQEKNWLKKLYYLTESRLLYHYEKKIANKAAFISVSRHDVTVYQQLFDAVNIEYLPVFIPYTLAVGKEGKGCFCFYHGNLSVNENEKAALWLLQQVFSKLTVPFVIAGKDPSPQLLQAAHQCKHTCIVANPSEKEMQDMIGKAHIHVLPSFNNTGIKLKLINALFNGRHCLVNAAGVEGSGLESACHIAEDADAFIHAIRKLYEQPFTEEEREQRQGLLHQIFNADRNAEMLIELIRKDNAATADLQ